MSGPAQSEWLFTLLQRLFLGWVEHTAKLYGAHSKTSDSRESYLPVTLTKAQPYPAQTICLSITLYKGVLHSSNKYCTLLRLSGCWWPANLGSLSQELLVFEPQSLLLHLKLLQTHLAVAPQRATLGAGGELGALLHWGALRQALLVHGCGEGRKEGRKQYPLKICEEEGAPFTIR